MARRPFFSGNYGSALGSFDTAAKLIAQAGQTQGQAMANIGAQVGGMIEQYGLNKQKREAEERTAVGNLSNFSPQDLLLLEKTNPQLGKAVQNLIDGKGGKKDVDLINAGTAPFIAMKTRDLEGKLKLAQTAGLEFKNKLAEQEEKQRISSIKLVQQEARGLVNNLLGLSGSERQEALTSLNPKQKQMIREYQLIEQGDIDPSNYMLSAEDALKMKVDMLEFEKLKGEIEDQDKERTDKEKDKTRKEREYAGLEVELSSIDQALNEGLITVDTLNPNQRYILSQRDNILQRLPLGERPDAVEVLAEDKKREFEEIERDADKRRFDAEKTLASDRNVFQTRAGTFRKDADGNVVRIGTPSENIGPVRLDKGEAIIQQGRKAAEEHDEKKEPLIVPTAAGGDVKGMLQDLTLYLGGKVGLSGKEVDEGGVLGFPIISFGLEEREEQTARLTAINALIKPILVNAVNSRGPVYTQKNVDEDILANPKQDNPTVLRRLNEYPRFLQESLTEAESVLRDPEIKPGTETYEKARRIALSAPRLLKVINASLGGQISTEFSDPSIDRILGGASDNKSTKTIPVPTTPMGSFPKEFLLKSL